MHERLETTMRNVGAGPDGVEYLAFGAGTDPHDAEMVQGWWSDENGDK
ncbi:MAG: hypothetical protein ACXWZT_11295 [Gaiellaceae bacterium]